MGEGEVCFSKNSGIQNVNGVGPFVFYWIFINKFFLIFLGVSCFTAPNPLTPLTSIVCISVCENFIESNEGGNVETNDFSVAVDVSRKITELFRK